MANTIFLNAATDNTLGGINASDVKVPSQKAVKDYVDDKLYNEKFANGLALQTNTSAAAAVTASMSGYEPKTNGRVSVKFKYANSADSTLDINGTGAKPIYYFASESTTAVSAMPAGYIKPGDIATFVYNGTQYVLTDIKRYALTLTVSGTTETGKSTGYRSPAVNGTIAIGTGSGTANYTPSGTITNGTITVSGGSTVSNLLTTSSTFTTAATAATTKKLTATLPSDSVVTGSGGTANNMVTSDKAPVATEFLTGVSVSGVATGGTTVNVHAALSGNPATSISVGSTGDANVVTAGTGGSAASTTHTHSVGATSAAKVDAFTAVATTTYKKLSMVSQTNGTAASCSLDSYAVGSDYGLKLSFTPNTLPTLASSVATGFTTTSATESNGVIAARTYTTAEAAAQAHTHTASQTEDAAQSVIVSVTTKKISASTTAPSVNLTTPATAGANDITVIGNVTTGSATVTPTKTYGVGFAEEPTLSRESAVKTLATGAPTITLNTTNASGGVRIPTNAASDVAVTPASDTATASALGSVGTISQDTSTFTGTGVELTATPSLTVESHAHTIPALTVTGTATE